MPYCSKCGSEVPSNAQYCPSCGAPVGKTVTEEYTISSNDLIKKIQELIHEGNITRIIVKDEQDKTLLEIPATVGVVGAILAPWLAALGVIAALATRTKIVIVRRA